MIRHINIYIEENVSLSNQSRIIISNIKNKLLSIIPVNKDFLEKELLKKILPFGLDNHYIKNNNNNNGSPFSMVCVLFTDIVNYTELANRYDDQTIFRLLNNVYILFDNIIKKYRYIQKIETIGDAYMAVGDIYKSTKDQNMIIKEIILFALELIREIKAIKTPDKKPLQIRVGINIGDVSIGILGNENPRLCVVGNTVNMASRLQSTADIDTIQISENIYEYIKNINFDNNIQIKKKEKVFLKNIGSVTTYNIIPQEI
jgi:class 3 adenylate cyclase